MIVLDKWTNREHDKERTFCLSSPLGAAQSGRNAIVSSMHSPAQQAQRESTGRSIGIGVALAAVIAVVLVAFLWPIVTASVKALPVAVVGLQAQVEQLESAIDDRAPDAFEITALEDREAAVHAIETREVYGAIVLDPQSPDVLIASAASPVVAQQLAGLAPALQAQLTAALAAQGVTPPSPIVVEVTDVVPLAATDERGAGLAASSLPLLIGSLLGGAAISLAIVGAWRRIAALLAYVVAAGFAIAAILQGWFGALQGDFLLNVGAIALALLAGSGVIVGLAAVLGRPGVPIGVVLLLLIANPISSAAQPVEFLLEPWGAVGQWFPPGAAATLLRDLSYFPAADATFPWLVLAGWAAVGVLLAALGAVVGRNRSPV
jgi:hypothetical protein